jgi:hypothetical protein
MFRSSGKSARTKTLGGLAFAQAIGRALTFAAARFRFAFDLPHAATLAKPLNRAN